MRKPRRNHQIPMGKDLKTKGKPSDSYEGTGKLRKNHQIPMGTDLKTNGKPSDSYGKD